MDTYDLQVVSRSIRLAPIIESLLVLGLKTRGPCLDYSAGYGLFTRMMRDRGFVFFHEGRDRPNFFAKHFEAQAGRYALVTALDMPAPADVEDLFGFSRNVLFMTTPPRRYDGMEEFDDLARNHMLSLYSSPDGLHFFTDHDLSPWLWRRIFRGGRVMRFATHVAKRRRGVRSLLLSDWEMVAGRQMR